MFYQNLLQWFIYLLCMLVSPSIIPMTWCRSTFWFLESYNIFPMTPRAMPTTLAALSASLAPMTHIYRSLSTTSVESAQNRSFVYNNQVFWTPSKLDSCQECYNPSRYSNTSSYNSKIQRLIYLIYFSHIIIFPGHSSPSDTISCCCGIQNMSNLFFSTYPNMLHIPRHMFLEQILLLHSFALSFTVYLVFSISVHPYQKEISVLYLAMIYNIVVPYIPLPNYHWSKCTQVSQHSMLLNVIIFTTPSLLHIIKSFKFLNHFLSG